MNRRGNYIFGLILIVIGGLFLLRNLHIFNFSLDFLDLGFIFANFWPLFIIVPGVMFHIAI